MFKKVIWIILLFIIFNTNIIYADSVVLGNYDYFIINNAQWKEVIVLKDNNLYIKAVFELQIDPNKIINKNLTKWDFIYEPERKDINAPWGIPINFSACLGKFTGGNYDSFDIVCTKYLPSREENKGYFEHTYSIDISDINLDDFDFNNFNTKLIITLDYSIPKYLEKCNLIEIIALRCNYNKVLKIGTTCSPKGSEENFNFPCPSYGGIQKTIVIPETISLDEYPSDVRIIIDRYEKTKMFRYENFQPDNKNIEEFKTIYMPYTNLKDKSKENLWLIFISGLSAILIERFFFERYSPIKLLKKMLQKLKIKVNKYYNNSLK